MEIPAHKLPKWLHMPIKSTTINLVVRGFTSLFRINWKSQKGIQSILLQTSFGCKQLKIRHALKLALGFKTISEVTTFSIYGNRASLQLIHKSKKSGRENYYYQHLIPLNLFSK